ncbi:hypothetical protein WJX77_003984 [Trebouxia sp. C0004]
MLKTTFRCDRDPKVAPRHSHSQKCCLHSARPTRGSQGVAATSALAPPVTNQGGGTGLFADLFTSQLHSMLEVGMGTGPNLKYFAAQKSVNIVGVDPNPEMAPYAMEAASRAGLTRDQLQMLDGTAEQLPVASRTQDAVICTLVLCSVPNVQSALAEVKRVLKPGGKFLFIEHVLAPEPNRKLRLFQHILNPLQQATADGCHLDRDTLKSIQSAGFANVDASSFLVPGLGLIGPHVAGIATVK